ncbi:MAG: PfkB family carbohydrate kinase [Gammaproteobacteria bacterium]|nr:PfkB family carbohydrate kinase [Gammaproteobacteria bacterium]
MARIFGVGIAAVDIINVTDGYPAEDQEVRALRQSIRRGGNATNTLVVLSQLGHQCCWLGTLADDVNSQVIIEDLKHYDVDMSYCQRIAGSTTPVSYITLNRQNGSRTIIHYRDLPELSAESVLNVPLTAAHWIHLEGRNAMQSRQIMDNIRNQSPGIPISVEIEKPRDNLELLCGGADTYLFSKAFALTQGFDSAPALLQYYRRRIPGALLVCTWGDTGAFALENARLLHAPAPPVRTIVDTIGAGDTFNAGFIHARLNHSDVQTALLKACSLAAQKITREGFNGLQGD